MAFDIKGWSPVGANARRGESVQQFTYKSADSLATMTAPGYFNEVADMLEVRDIVTVCDTATPATAICNVLSIGATGIVDLSSGLVVPETNT